MPELSRAGLETRDGRSGRNVGGLMTFSKAVPTTERNETCLQCHTRGPWSVRGSLALFGVDDQRVSSKLQEFRDLRDGFTAGLEAHYREGRGTA
jgi:hypothetical protein